MARELDRAIARYRAATAALSAAWPECQATQFVELEEARKSLLELVSEEVVAYLE